MTASSPKLNLLAVEEMAGMKLLPAGLPSEKHMGAVLNTAKIASLFAELREKADIVLVAGAPISWFAENLTLATHVDSMILVARPGEASLKVVNDVIENLEAMNIRLAGIIFDNSRTTFDFNPQPKKAFENTSAVPEDSHV